MLSPDDPRLVAHASGDLPPDEAAALEVELAASPLARERLAELRTMQTALREAFAAETQAESRLETRTEPNRQADFAAEPSLSTWFRWTLFQSFGQFATVACLVLLIGAIIIPSSGRVRESSRRAVDASNLRQIGQASLIAATELQNKMPGALAEDVWDYARITARWGGLNDAHIWASLVETAQTEHRHRLSTVLAADRATLDPEFAAFKPAWAVALHPDMSIDLPATTPIAWTRGLLPDGTWAAHAPNGKVGGHVVFFGGNVAFLRDTRNAFDRFDGGGKSSNILDALPPGARIAEYTPTEAEAAEWARLNHIEWTQNHIRPLVLPALWTCGLLILLTQSIRRRWPFSWVLWYLIISFGFLAVMPCW